MWEEGIPSGYVFVLSTVMENNTGFRRKLSVCMIAYNVGKYIGDAIEGVLKQDSDCEIELVISDDCSSDNTEEVVLKYIQEHLHGNWIKYKRQEKNLGSTSNYLLALENCTGDYIALCDGDDFWTDSLKVQKQVDFLESHPEYIGSFHNRNKLDPDGKVLSNSIQDKEKRNWSFDELISTMPEIPSASVIFRKPSNFKLPKEFEKVVINGDTFLWAYVLQFGDFYFDANIGHSVYRIHPQGLWSSKSSYRKSKLSLNTYQLLDAAFPGKQSIKSQIFNIRFNLFYYAIKEKEWVAAFGSYVFNVLGLLSYPQGFHVFVAFHKSIVFKGKR